MLKKGLAIKNALLLVVAMAFMGCPKGEKPKETPFLPSDPPTPSSTLPTLSTADITQLTSVSATLGGHISHEGTPPYTERGLCHHTSPNPTIANNRTPIAGSGTGSFSASLSNLSPGTTYYVRSYATNAAGTAYGEQLSFTTQLAPALTGPTTAYGEFVLSCTYAWPTSTRADDHYELEYSYNPESGYQLLDRGVEGERSSPAYFYITTDDGDAGKTLYFRARAYSNGSYTSYSALHPVSVPSIPAPFSINPARINFMRVSNDGSTPDPSTIAYPNSDVPIGTQWFLVYMVNYGEIQIYNSFSSALWFDLDARIRGRNISRAELRLYVKIPPQDPSNTYAIAAFAQPWSSQITAGTTPPHYTPYIAKAPPPADSGIGTPWVVDVTDILRNWANGSWENNGFYLWDLDYVFPQLMVYRWTVFYGYEDAPSPNLRPALYIEFQ
ncbi:MAG: DNRLRE domain-containing protein [Cystobacterineae bacterium]|nr:DNRLRE domain-containing protein [Cystobacterineae bacterium]